MTKKFSLPIGILTLLLSFVVFPATQTNKVEAAYEPGSIIANNLFLDASSMSPSQIQSFFSSKGAGLAGMSFVLDCDQAGQTAKQAYLSLGAPCGQTTSASYIIYYASQVYGISPKVILATIQKEQSLATAANPTTWQLERAMGYGCPTSGGCQGASTFFYQIDNGAWVLRFHYERARGNMSWWYTSSSWTCGTEKNFYKPNLYPGQNVRFYDTNGTHYTTIFIHNAATSSMYCYTPHAYNNPQGLYGRAPYGTTGLYYSGSYNFVLFYEAWFGSTQSIPIISELQDRYTALGGLSSYLGKPTTYGGCGIPGNGCYQNFQHGHIYWSPASGAWDVSGGIGSKWTSMGAERSYLLYPTGGEIRGLKNGGAYQQFQNGRIYWSASSGAWDISGAIGDRWVQLGATESIFGYPRASEKRGLRNGGAYQQFQIGRIYWTASTGAHPVAGGIGDYWINRGAQNSTLGYPTSGEKAGKNGVVYQEFEGGTIYWTAARGAWGVLTSVDTRYSQLGGINSYLGAPYTLGGCGIRDGGCYQNFLYGNIYWSPASGAWDVSGGIGSRWINLGAERSKLSYPASGEIRGLKNGGAYQQFQNGRIYWSPTTNAREISGPVMDSWINLGAEKSLFGYPVSSQVNGLKNNGAYQQFQIGRIYWTASTGAHPVAGGIGDYWHRHGSENGLLGYPKSREKVDDKGQVYQEFEGGRIYWTAARGAWMEN